ncbi:MAG: indolepyruvate ferredoxin oxidoreductase subunit alpha [Candidatus Pacearchaeota archaeon]|nr:MAG: indolepyruvate ferredoxin oxidoreductase subunit alpha [Candidatus Pacearchaeota archaeon]
MKKELFGKRGFLFGNEAIVRGALESGVGYASSYPGTPATEIGDTFAAIAKDTGIYFEWSVNEKVALEAAAGAVFSGIKALVSMKHYGLNVASDSLLPLVYLGCPFVVVVADDPGSWSSVQAEQDTRWFSRLIHVPTLEPSNSQEAKDMTKFAFQFSQKHKIPVLVRLTTRICYSKSLVNFGKIKKGKKKGKFVKKEFKLGSAQTVALHKKLLEKLKKIRKDCEKSKLNFIEEGRGKIGIITSGVAYIYIKEAFQELKIKLPLLKLGFSYPFPSDKVKNFLKNLKKVIVIEELDPIIEEEVKKFSKKIKIYGKDFFSEAGELKPEDILVNLSKILGKKIDRNLSYNIKNYKEPEKRIPFFCPGCPHRSTFYAVKKALGKKIFAGDIGCYMLGVYEPFRMQDFVVSMGASVGISHGISKASGQKPVIFIGDSTFFHAGLPSLLNLVYNKANALVIVLDNRWTAMTGHQPNPGSGLTGMKKETKIANIEEIAKALGVDFVKTSNVWNFSQFVKDLKQAYSIKGVSVIVAKGECRLAFIRQAVRKGIKLPKFKIKKQDKKLEQLKDFGCPAIKKEKGKWLIDKDLCWSCSICKQLFPDLIEVEK